MPVAVLLHEIFGELYSRVFREGFVNAMDRANPAFKEVGKRPARLTLVFGTYICAQARPQCFLGQFLGVVPSLSASFCSASSNSGVNVIVIAQYLKLFYPKGAGGLAVARPVGLLGASLESSYFLNSFSPQNAPAALHFRL